MTFFCPIVGVAVFFLLSGVGGEGVVFTFFEARAAAKDGRTGKERFGEGES